MVPKSAAGRYYTGPQILRVQKATEALTKKVRGWPTNLPPLLSVERVKYSLSKRFFTPSANLGAFFLFSGWYAKRRLTVP